MLQLYYTMTINPNDTLPTPCMVAAVKQLRLEMIYPIEITKLDVMHCRINATNHKGEIEKA